MVLDVFVFVLFFEKSTVGSAHAVARTFPTVAVEVDWVSECTVRHVHLAKWKNNSLKDRHIFLSASKLYPASCLTNEECYLGDKKSACAYRRGLL